MNHLPEVLLAGAVLGVGVLHTIVPDHWAPIALTARQRGWSKSETARAAVFAGTGHVVSTLLIGLVVWYAGIAVAARFGQFIETLSSLALIGFGGWVMVSAWRELRGHRHEHGHDHGHAHDHDHGREEGYLDDPLYRPLPAGMAAFERHAHSHRHGRGLPHVHWHDHTRATSHPLSAALDAEPPLHKHRHRMTGRTKMLIILGSSPMIEGLPAFFAASAYGYRLLAVMAVLFALGTIGTYVALCVFATAGLQRMRLGALERHGEVLSGALIALVGLVFGIFPVL